MIRRQLNSWAVVHNLEDFAESQLFMLGVVIVNGKRNCAVIFLKRGVK